MAPAEARPLPKTPGTFQLWGIAVFIFGFTELTTAIPQAGGPSEYSRRAFGPPGGDIVAGLFIGLMAIGYACFLTTRRRRGDALAAAASA